MKQYFFILVVLLFLLGDKSFAYNPCNCQGYSGPGGPCYDGPGGPCYNGPGGGWNCPSVCGYNK